MSKPPPPIFLQKYRFLQICPHGSLSSPIKFCKKSGFRKFRTSTILRSTGKISKLKLVCISTVSVLWFSISICIGSVSVPCFQIEPVPVQFPYSLFENLPVPVPYPSPYSVPISVLSHESTWIRGLLTKRIFVK